MVLVPYHSCLSSLLLVEAMMRYIPADYHNFAFPLTTSAALPTSFMSYVEVTVIPTFDIFYGGNRVARVEGANHAQVQELLERYQFQNSKLDLFSEQSKRPWDQQRSDPMKTPRTTNRFVPGYDWNSDKGFFDAAADKAQSDFEDQFENSWLPRPDD